MDKTSLDMIALGTVASLLAGVATAIGAVPVFAVRTIAPRLHDEFLGFAAGVMLAASFLSLIIPAVAAADLMYGHHALSAAIVGVALLIGVAVIWLVNELVPHEHFLVGRQGAPASLHRTWLLVIAIVIHNVPEGLAVGVGFGGGDVANGMTLAVGIGLQNMPEGLAVAAALAGEGYSRDAFLVAALSGLVEPIGGVVGVSAVVLSQPLLPWALSFAAGAMIFVVSHEIIQETHRRGFEKEATLGLVVGLVLMMYLDVTLG